MRAERGFALILVLILLGLGGLVITPALSLADTALRSRGVFAKDIPNDYAADSAIEYGMWKLKWEPGYAASLPVGVESPPIVITINGVTVTTTILAQAPADQLSGQPLAGPAQNIKFDVTKQVLPSIADPDVLTEFTYYVSIQCMDPNGCTDVSPYNQALERIEDCLPQGLTYVAGSVGVYPILFNDAFNRSDNNTVGGGWTDSDGSGSNARINSNYVRMRLGASITQSSISTTNEIDIVITYLWRGDPDAESADTLVVEWKRSDTGTWTTLATHPLDTSVGVWTIATHFLPSSANDTTIDIRFIANSSDTSEEARLDDVKVRSNVLMEQTLWDPVDWGVLPFEPSLSYDASYGNGDCTDSWRLRWDFNPDIAFTYGQTRTMAFNAEGTLAEGVYCNRIAVQPEDSDMRPGGTAIITVGDPAETRCSGGLLEVGKTTDTPVIYPNVETTITYTIKIKNVDTIPIEIDRVEDYLPTTGMADPAFVYVNNSAHGFIDRPSWSLLFFDNYDQPSDATPTTIPYWTDGDTSGNNCAIASSSSDEYARLRSSCAITKSSISTVDYSNITLDYSWMGANAYLFSDNFTRSDSDTVGAGWTESGGGASDCRISGNQVRLRLVCAITQSSISTASSTGIVLSYQWQGDSDAESSDTLIVQWKPSSSGTWNTLATHLLNDTNTYTPSYNLPASADNTTIDIRFTGNSSSSNEEARVDDGVVNGYRFADYFNRSDSNTVDGWTDSDGGGSNAAITSQYVRLRSSANITKSSISTVGFSSIVFDYRWQGSHSYLFTDNFPTNNSTVPGWSDSDGSGTNAAVTSNAVRLRNTAGINIIKSNISTAGSTGIVLSYRYWRGGSGSPNPVLRAEWKLSSGTWIQTPLDITLTNDSSQQQNWSLPAAANNTTIDIRFTDVNATTREAWVDDVQVDASVTSLTVEWKPSSSGTWNTLATHSLSTTSWTNASFTLPASADNTTIDIRFTGPSGLAYDAHVDDVVVDGTPVLTVAWKPNSSGTWNTLALHPLDITSWQNASFTLPASADNTTIDIRFAASAADEARLDNVKVSSWPSNVAFDGFESGDGSGGLGQWNGNWSFSGDYSVTNSSNPYEGTYHLRLRSSTGYAQRSANLSGYSAVQLRFWAKLNSFESGDTATVKVSTNGTTWDTLRTFVNGEDDDNYHLYTFDLSSYGSPATFYVAFDANMSSDQDYFYIDNVQFDDLTAPSDTKVCWPDQNEGADFLATQWYDSPVFRWGLNWDTDYYPLQKDPAWNPGGLCGLTGVAGGAIRPPFGYPWANYDPLVLNPGETLTIVFQAVVTLTASGSYYNEVFVRLDQSYDGTDMLYSWPVAGVTVPQYDLKATTLMSILRANASLTGNGAWKRSNHWKRHR